MLEVIVDQNILFTMIVGFAVLGILSKFIANVTLKRLVKAAGSMNKSTHTLMRLVRAKFEHACMVSDRVQNVGVFVDKYLYEYKVLGLKLYTWRRLEKISVWLCLILGGFYAGSEYAVYGIGDRVLQNGAAGAIAAVLVFLVHMTTDEGYQIEAAKNYMIDYLENVCAHRYEKVYQKDLQAMAPPETPIPEIGEPKPKEPEISEPGYAEVIEEVPSPEHTPEITFPVIPEPADIPAPRDKPIPADIPEPVDNPIPMEIPIPADIPATQPQIVMAKKTLRDIKKEMKKEETVTEERKEIPKPISKEVLIREILAEFLA